VLQARLPLLQYLHRAGAPTRQGIFQGVRGVLLGPVKSPGKIVILRCRMGMTILKSSFTGALPDGLS
jgi:hypothetical protein